MKAETDLDTAEGRLASNTDDLGLNSVRAKPRIGLLAGWGRFPIVVAETLRRQGCDIFCLGIKGHADPALRDLVDDFTWLGVAKLGRAIRYFRRHRVREATMAGKIHKTLIYQPWSWIKHFPDWEFVKTFYPHFVQAKFDKKDDTLLGTIVAAFERNGIRFAPATDYAPELLVKPGQLSGRPLSNSQMRDIEFGWHLAKEMGRLDIGQSVCVKEQAVLAIEAIEGTDECVRRAGALCPSGGFTVVKVAKPRQDMRFDVPTIGVGTLETMAAAGAKVLAVEAARTILLDESEFLRLASRLKIAVAALDESGRLKMAA